MRTEAHREASRRYYEKHRLEIIANQQKYRAENFEKCKAMQKEWYENNKEEILAKRKYNAENSHKLFREYIRQLIDEYEQEKEGQ